MPLQIIPQQNQPAGLQLLGDALNAGAADYVARRDTEKLRRQMLEDEQRKRGYQLSDVASNRTYEQSQRDRLRTLQLADEQRKRGEVLTDAKKRALVENRMRLLTEAEGRGLIDARQLGDVVAEDAALTRLQAQLSKEAEFSQSQPGNAQARLQELGQAEQAITQKMGAVEARLSAQPTVDQAAVAEQAVRAATVANGGKAPSRDQIQAALPDALAAAQQEAQVRWYQDKQDAQVQYQILSSQLNTIRQQQQNLTSTFKVAPQVAPSVLATPPPAAPIGGAPQGNALENFTRALNDRLPPPPTATSNDGPSVQNITSALSIAPPAAAPVLRQARTSLLADQYAKLDEPVFSTQRELADVAQKIQRLQSGLNPFQGVTPAPVDVAPAVQGELMTKLLLQQQALQRRLQQESQQRGAAKTGLLAGTSINTPVSSTPVTPPSPGSILSDRY